MYERAVREILDQCGSRLCLEGELTPEEITQLDGAAPKRFNSLYTVYGDRITSLIQIDEDTCIMIAGDKNVFKGLKTEKIFKEREAANEMLNRLIKESPINFDHKFSPLAPHQSL